MRERGLKLLSALHEGTHYKRIIIVSHSLGTMLAHDLLSYFWAQREAPRRIAETSPEFDALCELERAAAAVDLNPTAAALDQYYEAQRRLRVALVARAAPLADDPQTSPDPRWLITDFVTLGSPLAHAEFLIAANAEDLARRKFERELPESPPLREELDPNVFRLAQATHKLPVGADFKTSKLISFPPPSAPHVWELHHAAPFAVVRWVNVYDTASLVFRGDIIGGPLAKPSPAPSPTPSIGRSTASRSTSTSCEKQSICSTGLAIRWPAFAPGAQANCGRPRRAAVHHRMAARLRTGGAGPSFRARRRTRRRRACRSRRSGRPRRDSTP